MSAVLLLSMFQNGLERFELRMNIGQNRKLHPAVANIRMFALCPTRGIHPLATFGATS